MPIYEYECPKCGQFEVTQRITEAQLKKCPDCRSNVRKLISSTSFQLKGSGWYVTDYARKDGKKPKETKVAESTADTGASKSESSSESKSESKKESSAKAA